MFSFSFFASWSFLYLSTFLILRIAYFNFLTLIKFWSKFLKIVLVGILFARIAFHNCVYFFQTEIFLTGVVNSLLLIFVINHKNKGLVAENGELHCFLDKTPLSFAISHISSIFILDEIYLIKFLSSHEICLVTSNL